MKHKRPVYVLGCGSIGRRHAGNLRKLGHPVIAFDPDRQRRNWVERNIGCSVVPTIDAGFAERPKAVWVCTPPSLHADAVRKALGRGLPCFVEKPLSATPADARLILELSRKNRVPIAVGYQLRYHPGLQWLKKQVEAKRWGRLLFIRAEAGQYLPDWRPWQNYRNSYTARKDMGGGILLDASHEIDLLRWLAGEVDSVFCSAAKLSALDVDVEDTAEIILHFKSKTLGEVHLDMVQRAYRRGLHLAFENGTVTWGLPAGKMKIYSSSTERWQTRSFTMDFNELYVREAKAFLAHLDRRSQNGYLPAVEGARTLAVVAAAHKSAKTRKLEKVS